MKQLTVIIPTYNMGRYLPTLFESIVNSALAPKIQEIIFVCDQSSDGSEEIIRQLASSASTKAATRVTLLEQPQRRGVFMNRWIGAMAAQTPKLLFLDSRQALPEATAEFLSKTEIASLNALSEIDPLRNLYSLYWLRSHAALFARREREVLQAPIKIHPSNFDDYVVGTGGFYCSRDVFLLCCEKYANSPLFSDDTLLMKDMSALEPIVVHKDYRIRWEPRDQLIDFLKHLYHRGPGFAEYHLFERRGALFYAVVAGALFVLLLFVLLLVNPIAAIWIFAVGLISAAASTLFLARSFGEFVRLAPLHVAVIAAYGFGAIRGAWVVWKKRNLKSSILPLR